MELLIFQFQFLKDQSNLAHHRRLVLPPKADNSPLCLVHIVSGYCFKYLLQVNVVRWRHFSFDMYGLIPGSSLDNGWHQLNGQVYSHFKNEWEPLLCCENVRKIHNNTASLFVVMSCEINKRRAASENSTSSVCWWKYYWTWTWPHAFSDTDIFTFFENIEQLKS